MKVCIIKFFGCLQAVMLVLCNFLYGQQIKCQVKHYSAEDGLSHEKVTSILKDKAGFIWFGTWDGVNRFDGHTFVNYKSYAGDNSNLRNNRIFALTEDHAGYLWILTDERQVYRFDKKNGHFFPALKVYGDVKPSKYLCTKIVPSKTGTIWLLSDEQGVVAVSKPYTDDPVITKYALNVSGAYHLPAKNISFFHEDKQQNIWIGTSNGLVQLIPDASGKYATSLLDHQYADHSFTSIVEDDKSIIFTTKDGFLVFYDKRSRQFVQTQFAQTQGLNGACISKKNNIIYCTTGTGDLLTVSRADMKVLSAVKVDTKPILSIYEDHADRLWIEPFDNGVFKYDLISKTLKYFTHKLYSANNIGTTYSAFEDSKGYTWINMKGHGFGYYDADKDAIDPFYNDPNFENYKFSNKVIHYYYDPTGVLWLSTEKRGLEKIVMLNNSFHQQLLVPRTFIQTENEVRTVYQDRESRLWVAAKEKLYTFFAGKKIDDVFINPPARGLHHVYGMCEDRDNNFWFATRENGLYKAEPVDNTRTKYRLTNFVNNANDPYSLSSNTVYSVIEDKIGQVWVGTYGAGLNLVDTKNNQTKFYNLNNVFKGYPKSIYQRIRHLATDPAGNIWMGTTDGLLILDPARGDINKFRFKGYNKVTGDKESLGNNDVQFVYKDNTGRMWLCTAGGGLNLALGNDPFKKTRFKAYTIKNGLSNDYTLSCVQDNSGKLWIATQKGISELNIPLQQFKNYDSNDGLPQTGFSESCSLKLPNGNIIFGMFSGYLQFKPEAMVDQKIDAKMALTSLQIDGKNVSAADDEQSILKTDINYTPDITLNYDENDLNLAFSILDYRTSDRQSYTYRMLGLDTGWTQSGINHLNANYSNLPPGNYTFQVKSINEDLYLRTPYKQLFITVLPPLWRTWWAYLAYVIMALIGLAIIRRTILTMLRLRHRIAVEQHLTELKLNFFTNISHELRTPLTLILNPINAISKDETLSAHGREYAQIIMKNANRMVRFINQLLDLRKVQSGKAVMNITETEIIAFVENIGSYFDELGKEKEVGLKITSNVKKLHAWVDSEKLDIVIYNLLSNAYKFSEKGSEIVIRIEKDTTLGCFSIKIIDQGIGVPQDKLEDIFELYYEGEHKTTDNQKGTGIGLALAKELIVLHHGKISAANNATKGLTVAIELKLGKPEVTDEKVNFLTGDESHLNPDEDFEVSTVYDNVDAMDDEVDHPLILLVEDNSDLRRFLVVQLNESYRVAEAENGQDGYEKALNLLPDLILSDVMMPVMDGIQMLDKLKNDVSTSHIPVVLLSAKYSIESQLEGLKYGADLYIAKPFNNELLLASLANIIKRKKMFETVVSGQGKIVLSPSDVVITAKDEDFLKKIINVVEEGMSDPDFNIDDFADATGMSRSVFFRKLKTLTNSSPVEFLRDMRVKRGKQLLDAGETNIAQVAYAVGFNDAKYFGACFKKQYHYTPSEYVKNLNA
ncbi:response regulator [Mucilaginibacter sp. HMF5004]|uniref:hybrid sensor histidine kinase/response regulator transcription factor n=1 Tax=Mucilaginibacter rivuli TaxID=2857527 RepID=UPI001C5F8798|nr:two-component regulator propeller domain-containing protein [Mucilaginibacter rivuli]MBW4888529.1 response regulator [Mucilaginibacter rivuli]